MLPVSRNTKQENGHKSRAPWPCGLIRHVLDQEDGGSNLGDAFNLLNQWKRSEAKQREKGRKLDPLISSDSLRLVSRVGFAYMKGTI